jgi:hypothetical protein
MICEWISNKRRPLIHAPLSPKKLQIKRSLSNRLTGKSFYKKSKMIVD